VRELQREVRELRKIVTRLSKALYTHTRTDLAPDAALPKMKAIVEDLTKKSRRRRRSS